MQQWTVKEPYLVIQGQLLEGPLYDDKQDECRFFDIISHKLWTFSPRKGASSVKEITTTESIGVTGNIKGAAGMKYIAGARNGFGVVDAKTGDVQYIRKVWDKELDGPEKEKLMRSNDGAIDSRGRFWVGAMGDPLLAPSFESVFYQGILFRLDPDLSVHRMLHSASAPNGIGWNADETIMYWTDSEPSQNIYAFDFAAEPGSISNQRVFWNAVAAGFGKDVSPDGLVVDSEDCVWTALWRGYKVVRVSPQGQIIGEVVLPTAYVTCPVFVGTELLITTARDPKIKEEGIERGGDVYMVDVGIRGESRGKHEFVLKE